MNIHPIFVHFPVAFLTLYAFLELVRFQKVLSQPYWFYVKAVLVMAGSLGALVALFTGNMAKHLLQSDESLRPLIGMHEKFAYATTAIFGVVAISYLILWLARVNFVRFFVQKPSVMKFWRTLVTIAHVFGETKLVIFLALVGLVCVTITGGLGGVIVFGDKADPFFGVVYRLLFPGM